MSLAPNATSYEVEKFFIAAVMVTGNEGRSKVRFVEAEHFADRRHQLIWKAILKIENVGWLLLKETLKDGNHDDIIEYAAKQIMELKPEDPLLALAKRITDLASYRQLGEAANEIVRLSVPNGADAEDAYTTATTLLRKAKPVTMTQDIHSQEEMIAALDGTISAERQGSTLRSVPMPFKELKQFGGLCVRVPRKKMVAIAGDWGTGKSTFARDILDGALEMGFNCLIYSPEWTPAELAAMTLQKYGGPSVVRMQEHADYWSDIRAGYAPMTKPYDDVLKTEHKIARQLMQERKGRIFHIDRRISVEALEDRVLETRNTLAKEGKTLDALFIDYATKLKTDQKYTNDFSRNNFIMEELIALGERYDLAVFVVSQVNKAGGREAKKNNTAVDTHEMHGVRGDDPKLIITISPEYDEKGEKNGWANIYVGKQNLGRTGLARMKLNVKRQTWVPDDDEFAFDSHPDLAPPPDDSDAKEPLFG